MQRKDLALRVLSTAAIMSIVTSIAAPAFADIYYIGNGSIDVVTKKDTDGNEYVEVKQGDNTYTDTSDEIVIKDGTSEADTTLTEAKRAEGTRANPAVAPAAGAATQELEAAGSADAAGESQPDPDAAFTLSEAEEDSAQTQEGKDTTEEKKEPAEDSPKEDVVYEYAPADPNPEQQATKLAPTTSAAPTAKTQEAALDDTPTASPAADPATTTPAEGSAKKPTKNVIRVINNWAEKVLNIRLSNVNVKVDDTSRYADGTREQFNSMSYGVSAAEVQGTGKTKIELDGQNVLDSRTSELGAGLRKKDSGNLTITDETSDKGETITAKEETETSGSLRAEGGIYGGAGIGGNSYQATDNITIEGYATVNANTLGYDGSGGYDGAGIGGGTGAKGSNITIQGHANVTADGGTYGAGIGGGGRGNNGGDAENITIRDYAKVTATGESGIGGGFDYSKKGNAKNIVIQGHATVDAKGSRAAIGAAWGDNAEVTIGTAGATAEQENVHVTATSSYGAAIGNGAKDTKVTIQGHVTIQTALDTASVAIGSEDGNVTVNIKDNASINAATGRSNSSIGGWKIDSDSGRKVVVNIDGGEHGKVKLGENSPITGGLDAISGTEVNIGNNVLLKIKQSWKNDKYIAVNNAEAEVGTRSNPAAGGLVNTIGDNTELWYTDYNGVLQKIVHGKNVCTKNEIDRKDATCTEDGWVKYECTYEHDNNAAHPEHKDQWVETIPATGHHWKDNGDGTHTCPDCGATEGQPVNTNSALELRVVDAEGMNQPFTVSQNGTLRTYTGAYDTATLTGDLDTLRYLQDHGAQTIQFVTNGQTSSFAINDLLAQGSGSEVFYLTHRGAEEPTLLLVEADHSELVKD